MATDIVKINIPVNVDTKGAGRSIDYLTRNLKQAEKETTKLNAEFQRSTSSIKGMAKGMLTFGAAFTAGIMGLSAMAPSLSGELAILKVKLMSLGEALAPSIQPIIQGFQDMVTEATNFINTHPEIKSIGETIGKFISEYGLETVVGLFTILAAITLGGIVSKVITLGTWIGKIAGYAVPAIGSGSFLAALGVGGALYIAAEGFLAILNKVFGKQNEISNNKITSAENIVEDIKNLPDESVASPSRMGGPYKNVGASRQNNKQIIKRENQKKRNRDRTSSWSKAGADVGTGIGATIGGFLGAGLGGLGAIPGAALGAGVGRLAGAGIGAAAGWVRGLFGSKQNGGLISRTGAYMLHQGEKVVPRNITQMGSGSQPISINIQTGAIRSQADISSLVDQISREMNFRQGFARGVA